MRIRRDLKASRSGDGFKGDTVAGNGVWNGHEAMIMPGMRIGNGAIVAAKSVMTSDVPPDAIVGGNPAKVIRRRFPDEVIAELLAIRGRDCEIDNVTRHLGAI
jgi:virginiamycin A acetyltransferase